MRTVTSRKELLDGIKAGERHFKVKGKFLLLQCALAEKFNGTENVTKAAVASALPSVAAGAGFAMTGGILLALTAMVIVGTIAIIAVVKGRHLRIKVKDNKGNEGEIEVF